VNKISAIGQISVKSYLKISVSVSKNDIGRPIVGSEVEHLIRLDSYKSTQNSLPALYLA